MVTIARPRFPLGQVLATPGAVEALKKAGHMPDEFIRRHHVGDWGEVSKDDAALNEEALRDGSRLLSVYKLADQTKIWIITEAADDEAKREATTILLPSEY